MLLYLLGTGEGAARRLDISTRAGRPSPWGPRRRGRRAGAAPTSGLAEVASQHEVCVTFAKAFLQTQVTSQHQSHSTVLGQRCMCLDDVMYLQNCFLGELDNNEVHTNGELRKSFKTQDAPAVIK